MSTKRASIILKEENEIQGLTAMSSSPKKPATPRQVAKPAAARQSRKINKYPALLVVQNQHRFYFATIPVDDLFPYCFVSRREEDPETGFQRALNESRANDIAAYLAKGPGSIPSNIVLSAQSATGFTYRRKVKSISFARVPGAFLVLDGQHRLWGYHKCAVRLRVPVAIYQGLTRAEEAKLFIDINTTQRGVPAALLLDIKQIAETESSKEQWLREIFDKLQQDPKSSLAGKLSPARSLAGKISRVTFNKAVGPVLSSRILSELSATDRYKLILNYINAFDAEIVDKRILTMSAYFESIFELLDEVVRDAIALYKNAKQDSLQKAIQPLAKLDLSGTSTGKTILPKKAIVTLMQTTLRKNLPISGEML